MPKVPKDFVTTMMGLMRAQPWLAEKASSLAETLEECESEEQQTLLLEMLSRFSYLSETEYSQGLTTMARHLFIDNHLKPSKTQLYGMQMSRDTDSSNEVAYRMRRIIARDIDDGIKHFATMNRIPEVRLEERPSIVIVDEFIGSGHTAIIRLEHLFQRAKDTGQEVDPERVYLCFLAGMDFALERVREKFPVNVYCYKELKKGIDGYYQGELKEKAYSAMESLTKSLCNPCPITEEELKPLGYGDAEALYYREEGNPPNNNFPIFWWRYRKAKGDSYTKRSPLLRRAV